MIREQRLSYIQRELQEKGIVSIAELTKTLCSSRSTIRRDLCDLEEQCVLKCIRGGAAALPRQTANEPSFHARQDLFGDEKQRIARRAMEFVLENATLLLDSGTTVYELAKRLALRSRLNIATNDLQSAMSLSSNPELSVFVLGGTLRARHFSMNGLFTEQVIQQLHADTAFLSVDAVDLQTGLMAFSMEEMPTKRLMIRSAQRTILLCDHSKFENVAFVSICPVSDIDIIITGSEIDSGILARLREQDVTVITA